MTDSGILRDINAMPVNVKARKVLEGCGEKPLEGSLHCAQLAMYAIENDEVIVEMDVAETVKAMMAWRPQRIVNFFVIMNGGEYDPPGWEAAAGLKEFAQVILDDIENKIVTHFPYYRSPES